MMKVLAIVVVAAALALGGCAFERHFSIEPGENQVVKVASGDRFFFEMDEGSATGSRWDYECDDSDVEVRINHREGKAKVLIRIHRGYDGPSSVKFFCKPKGKDGEREQEFTVNLFKRTGDWAFWE